MSCFALSSASLCGSGFAGFPVLTSQFANETAFNTLIQSAITPDVTTFQDSNHGCAAATTSALSTAVAAMRYQISFDCVTIVANALQAGCSAPSNTDLGHVVLCGNLCSIAITTYQNVYATQGCTSTGYVSDKLLSRQNACANMTASLSANNDQTCLLGVSPELNQCGFVSASASTTYCAANPSDQCCSFPSGVQYAVLNKATGQYYVPSASSSGPSAVLIGGVVGGVVAVVAIAAVAFFLYRRKKAASAKKAFDTAAMYQQDMNSFRSGPAYPAQPQPTSIPYPAVGRSKPPSEANYMPQPQAIPIQMAPTQMAPYKSLVGPSTIAPSTVGSMVGTGPIKSSNEIMRIIHPYEALLQDELDLVEGDDLILVKKFDDGWAQGINPLTGKQGAFPLVCVVPAAEYNSQKAADQKKQARDSRMSKRMSSMVGSSIPVNKKASMAVSYVSTAISSVTDASTPDKMRNTLRVLFPYQAQQDDELDLVVGNDIILLKSFDDGWALGMQPLTGQKGAFPLACVDQGNKENRISNRASSLMSWQE